MQSGWLIILRSGNTRIKWPVSYTHLYKIFYSCAFILILCAIHPIIYYEEIGSATVSYTHLDVYKRQRKVNEHMTVCI